MTIGRLGGEGAATVEEIDRWLRMSTERPSSVAAAAARNRLLARKARADARLASPPGGWWSTSPELRSDFAAVPCEPGDPRLAALGR